MCPPYYYSACAASLERPVANNRLQENHFYSIRPSLGSLQEPQNPPWLMSAYPRRPRVNTLSGPLALSARMAAVCLARPLYREMGFRPLVVGPLVLDDLVPVCGLPSGARAGWVSVDV